VPVPELVRVEVTTSSTRKEEGRVDARGKLVEGFEDATPQRNAPPLAGGLRALLMP
jgi:hypothetical protein